MNNNFGHHHIVSIVDGIYMLLYHDDRDQNHCNNLTIKSFSTGQSCWVFLFISKEMVNKTVENNEAVWNI